MCNDCQRGYFPTAQNECQRCPPGAKAGTAMFFILLAAAAVLTVALAAVFLRTPSEPSVNDYAISGNYLRARHPRIPYSARATLFYVQAVGMLLSAALPWPKGLRNVMQVLDLSNLSPDEFALQCTFSSFGSRYAVLALVPIVWAAVVGAAIALLSLLLPGLRARDALRIVYFNAAPVFYFPVAVNTLSLFDCSQLPDGKWYLDIDLGTQCFSPSWKRLLPLGILACLLYIVLVPLSTFLGVYLHRRSLRAMHTLRVFGSLYRSYRSAFSYLETINVLKRLALVLITLFLSRSQAWQLILYEIVLLGMVGLHMRQAPMYTPILNSLESMLHLSLGLLAMLGFVFFVNSGGVASYAILVICGVGLCLIALAAGLFVGFAEVRVRRNVLSGKADGDLRLLAFKDAFVHDAEDWVDPHVCALVSASLGTTDIAAEAVKAVVHEGRARAGTLSSGDVPMDDLNDIFNASLQIGLGVGGGPLGFDDSVPDLSACPDVSAPVQTEDLATLPLPRDPPGIEDMATLPVM
eukprot:c41742_g1_i1.p1 GENE.c41742_g1_i1~~c41742_g1_i1.p1  ORF type:complete len:522 (-),score=71.20 c41742_g1_i1:6-1571(-)